MRDYRFIDIRDAVYGRGYVSRDAMIYLCEKIAELDARLKKVPAHYRTQATAVTDGLRYDRV
jgi:hypothetical protein